MHALVQMARPLALMALVGGLVWPGLSAQGAQPAVDAPPNYSGSYDCTGYDRAGRAQAAPLVLERLTSRHRAADDVYVFRGQMRGEEPYAGFATARGKRMALYFRGNADDMKAYHMGVATFNAGRHGKWLLQGQFFSEAQAERGQSGAWTCVQL